MPRMAHDKGTDSQIASNPVHREGPGIAFAESLVAGPASGSGVPNTAARRHVANRAAEIDIGVAALALDWIAATDAAQTTLHTRRHARSRVGHRTARYRLLGAWGEIAISFVLPSCPGRP
jgi:hypothetical protein